ncbi:MAG: histidine kinase [Rubrivivax sp.]|nr:histidine kinase [Rubrivivax sp.]
MPDPQDPKPDFAPTGSRAASLWPESQRVSDFRSTVQALTGFNALAGGAPADAAYDLCQPALGLRAVLLVQLVLAIAALAGSASAADWLARQGAAAFGGAAGTVLWLALVCAARRWLGPRAVALRGGVMLLLGALVALLVWAPLVLGGLAEGGVLRLLGTLLAGSGLAALLWAWLELRARLWQPAASSARLAELQSRIRPHFLFNTLNTAVALVRVDPARAEAVLEDLAELFRVALAETGSAVTLADEVELARRYLAIEAVRFGQRLQVSWDLEPRALQARVPPLVLQPLVENAVRHGVEPAAHGAQVRIEVQARLGQALVTVHNSVGDEPSPTGHGIALDNVRERLRLLHDLAGQCETWRDDAGFHARITVPL